MKLLVALFFILLSINSQAEVHVTVMAPLYVGDIHHPKSSSSEKQWQLFEQGLKKLKAAGVHAISVDVWWGLVQNTSKDQFNWSYYHRIFSIIRKSGLKIQAILSFHKAGGNVGDTVNIPLPAFSFDPKNYNDVDIQSADDLKYVGADGVVSDDCHSAYVTPLIMPFLEAFMKAFRDEFAFMAGTFDEINMSLGPAGELRFPSYKPNTPSDYPNSGVIQAFSTQAVRKYRHFLQERYEYDIDALKEEFGVDYGHVTSFEEIEPPRNLDYGWESRPSGYIFNRFNHGVLLHSARVKLSKLDKILKSPKGKSGFENTPIGFKVPGVHWQSQNRSAEIAAGVVSSNPKKFSTNPQNVGYLYEPVLNMVKVLNKKGVNVRAYFTAFEMDDGMTHVHGAVNDPNNRNSLAKSLAHSVGRLAHAKGLELGGENALEWNLNNPRAYSNMLEAVENSGYSHITLLRYDLLANNDHAYGLLKKFIGDVKSCVRSLVLK